MGVADEAASWLYGKVRDKVKEKVIDSQATHLGDDNIISSSTNTDDTAIKAQLMSQQANRAKFDKWFKRVVFFTIGASATYVYFEWFHKKRS